MDDLSCTISYMMQRAMTMVGYLMLADLVRKMLEDEREKVKAALGHEPTQENWQDYYDLKLENTNRQNARQREIDKEKLRRLVFGEDDNGPKAG